MRTTLEVLKEAICLHENSTIGTRKPLADGSVENTVCRSECGSLLFHSKVQYKSLVWNRADAPTNGRATMARSSKRSSARESNLES